MKAIRIHAFGGPEALQFEQTPDPKPGAGQVLVRAKAIGVNPVDVYIRTGGYGERSFPFVPGMDAAGVVEAVGPDVQKVKAGDRVYIYGSLSGAYAELILCKESQVHSLPQNVSFSQGAAVGVPYTTAYYGLFYRGHALSGETILVHGASGGVGIAVVQLARSRGLTVIGTVGTPKGRDLVFKEGAHHVLYHSMATYMDDLMKLTQGKGVQLILEMAAHTNLGKDLKVLTPRGRVVVIGSRGQIMIDPRDAMGRNADIRGMSLLTVSEEEISNVQAALGAGLENGTLRPVVGKEFPLAEASKAHDEVMKPGAFGKIVLIP